MRICYLVLGACALFLTTHPVHAQTGAIEGRVTDAETGAPLPGVNVALEGTTRGAATDAGGAFRIEDVEPGPYTIIATAIGYGSARREIVLAPGEDVAASLRLEPAQYDLSEVVVAATRTGTAAASLPVKVDVIEARELAPQRSLTANPAELLSNLIPSFSPSRQKLTGAGESFRGRSPLFLIDGVPQTNPLRDGSRDGFTIDMEVIERVEVIFGANAIQGLGATGGVINYVTVSPSASGELEQRAAVSATSGDGFEEDGFGWRGHYLAARKIGDVDVLGAVGYEQRGLQFDGRDRPIALDNVQGDIADSYSRNFFGKLGWEPAPDQRFQLMLNDFRLAQQGDFEVAEGDRARGVPAVSVPGDPEGTQPVNDVTTASLSYEHTALAGGTLSAKGYYQDFAALYGGGRFGTFQDPRIAPEGELFDQSENNSEKYGTRLTYTRADVADAPVDVIAGFDFLRDETYQRLDQTDRNWVPMTRFFNYAPFLQLELHALEGLSVSGGLRWELAELDVPDFTTLAGNREDFQRVDVAGGRPSFDEPLVNMGGVVAPVEGLRFYGTFSQAFTMPDVGRVLRGISEEGTAVEDFLALDPIKTDNLELGSTYATTWGLIEVTYFESESDFGARLVPNADGIFQVIRQPTKTSGWELSGRVEPVPFPFLSFGAGYSRLEGRFDGDGDGTLDSDLGAADIGPDRLNLMLDVNRGRRFSGRLQSFTFFDRTFRDGDDAATARFDGYTLVDGSVAARFGLATITFAVSNLLDEQYITYYGQAATDRDDRYFAGRGRTLTLRAEARF